MRFTSTYQPISRDKISGQSLAELRAHLDGIEQKDSIQVGLYREDGEGLSAYFNANRAWLIWGNTDGDWAYPVNPAYRELDYDEEEC